MAKPQLETVKEDCIEFWIYGVQQEIQENILDQVNNYIKDVTKDYIWHKDCLRINLPVAPTKDLPPHLYSLTYYGDNIEDEWFIVYVLLEITKKFPGLVAQLQDNDGDFLLIEAADELPKWANPETTKNRVFLVNGKVHLISPEVLDLEKCISVEEALNYLKSNASLTCANSNIQHSIKKRIEGYPQQIKENLHRSIVRLPVKFAALLRMKPGLIAQAVNAYCSRDTVESNICKKIELEDCIDTSVTFTKCLYAALMHANLLQKASWRLPPKSSNEHTRGILGVKLACGFHILLSKASPDTFTSKQWNTYLESLEKIGYFKENIEGSKEHTKLLNTAKQYFLSNECDNISGHIGNDIKELMDTKEYKDLCCKLIQEAQPMEQDSDDWLSIDPDELNTLMTERYGKSSQYSKSCAVTPQNITDQLSSFLKQSSDFEGIELSKDKDEEYEEDGEKIKLDLNTFTDSIRKILDSVVSDRDDESDIDTEDEMELDDNSEDEEMKQYHNIMEEELSKTSLAPLYESKRKGDNIQNEVYQNFKTSVKEEEGASGPSSNLLSNIGINKQLIRPLDSDDDDHDE